ncbi:MAG: hypothetical protein HN742_11165 [Lentisphaerae bacterium]|jgi:hypothetical protein|nr:hypothetical protein [Lentisphaerota bacterium]MBT5610513.1 hypothetical protein [Lentisphaerota bacterium]MBT7056068.1 hypothetical protein [Lentisphaerota bacterium]MBT7842425.1 hypothetical protein [Lentisphaerota bacterium]
MSAFRAARILDPLAWWDVASLYDRYAGAFDLFVYCAFFTAVARLALRGKFSGRPGRALAGVIGIALGTALAVTASRHAWSLRRAGPMAIAIGLLVVGIVLFQLVRIMGTPGTVAVSLTYLSIFLLMHAVSPELTDYLDDQASGLGVVLYLIFYGCLLTLFGALALRATSRARIENTGQRRIARTAEPWHGREKKLRKAIVKKPVLAPRPDRSQPRSPRRANGLGRRLRRALRSVRRSQVAERGAVSKAQNHVLPEAQHKIAKVEHTLAAVRAEAGKPTPSWEGMARATSQIAHGADTTIELIDRVRTLDRRIRTMDWRQHEELRKLWGHATDEEKEKLRSRILLERNKIIQESAGDALAQRCERRHQDFRRVMDDVGKGALSQQRKPVLDGLALAIEIQEAQGKDLGRLQAVEKKLKKLTKARGGSEASGGPGRTAGTAQDQKGAPGPS